MREVGQDYGFLGEKKAITNIGKEIKIAATELYPTIHQKVKFNRHMPSSTPGLLEEEHTKPSIPRTKTVPQTLTLNVLLSIVYSRLVAGKGITPSRQVT